MSLFSFSFILVILSHILGINHAATITEDIYIDCVDVLGNIPTNLQRVQQETNAKLKGAYLNTARTECIAQSHCDSGCTQGGIQVYARCCNITDYTSSFNIYESGRSAIADDATISIDCSLSTEELI